MITQPLMFACVLSSGSTWSQPPILPALGDTWPTGAQAGAYAVFTDTTGAVLATITGQISAQAVVFQGIPHTQVDAIPAGANCEIFVTDTSGNPYKIRYGRVVRREVNFPNAPGQVTSYEPLAFSDTLQRTALGNNWVPLFGSSAIYPNAGLPNGAAAVYNSNLLAGYTFSELRWFQPLNTDAVSLDINLLNMTFVNGQETIAEADLIVMLCGDINLNTWVGAHFSVVPNQLQIVTGAGALASTPSSGALSGLTAQGQPIANTIANNDNYVITFNEETSTISVYKNASTSPILTWQDTNSGVPHGPGYRYSGLAWNTPPDIYGIEVSSWSAQDQV